MKTLVGAFNQEKTLVGAFSVIVQIRWLVVCSTTHDCVACSHHIHGCCAVINSIKCLSYPLYMKNTDITSLIFCGTIMNNNLLFFTPPSSETRRQHWAGHKIEEYHNHNPMQWIIIISESVVFWACIATPLCSSCTLHRRAFLATHPCTKQQNAF